ncbi:MAG: hypothetical protein ABIH59_00760 [archaeon]
MNIGQLISGLALSILGFVLVVIAVVSGFKGGSFLALIYGLPALVIGLVILFNKKEDKIEAMKKSSREIKQKGGRKK